MSESLYEKRFVEEHQWERIEKNSREFRNDITMSIDPLRNNY